MLDIEDLDYHELKDGLRQLAEREREMERAALHTLQHHAFRHSLRLFCAAIGFPIPEPHNDSETHETEEPVTA